MAGRDLSDNLTGDNQNTTHNALEAEKSLLSLCMRNAEALTKCVEQKVVSDDFSDQRHSTIYECITSLYLENVKTSRMTVCEKLLTTGKTAKAGGDEYVYAIANVNSVMSALDTYISIVTTNSSSRKLVNTLTYLEGLAKDRKGTVNDIVDLSIAKLNILKDEPDGAGFEQLSTILNRNFKELSETLKGTTERKVTKTGFSYLDKITGGFKPGTINIIAARPGMGKTSLVLNIARNVAGMYGKPVLIFSLEMSKAEVANKILASMCAVSYKSIERATITKEEEAELTKTISQISSMPLYIDEKTDTNPMDIMAKCKEFQQKGIEIGLVIIDYLQLLTYPGKSTGSRQNEIAEISRSLKILAKELKVPVIALSQLNRQNEKRDDGDKIPELSDIRDSGAIEQDADSVIFIHRPDYYNKNKEHKKIEDAQLIVAKNRHGSTDTAYVKWLGERTMFFEPDRKGDPEDPQGSAFTRTQSSSSASSDYQFGEPPPEEPDFDPGEPPYEPMDEDIINQDNDDFFNDANTGLPEEF
ncbi:MAG: replicative DNA helicase [Saccharofermentans sp.]|nr:replicative DNA helicase [Saccharofermentans sp.]